ncbi:MAG: hypothetical protein KBS96_09140 [Lachnospiraceae bacterium]|nr:hypothetical protein [Candidatus Colinaster scatohippi]
MFGNNGSVVVGYDLSNEYAQISYTENGAEPGKTISLTPGTEQYNIPVCLFKRSEVNQWFVGQEAVNYSEVEEGEMVGELWERALVGDNVSVVGEEFDPLALLALYIRRSLVLLTSEVKKERIKGIMFTVPNLTKRALEVLEIVTDTLEIGDAQICFQGREESIYYYIAHQPADLWQHDVEVYDYNENGITAFRFHRNKMTKPLVAFVDRKEYEAVGGYNGSEAEAEVMDNRFSDVVKDSLAGHIVSCAYLLGTGFEGDWCKDSLRELCRNRRAFRGNNLYSRGACYAMQDNLTTKLDKRNMIFLGKGKLRANVGMNVMRGREESYLALLDGGENWFDSKKTVDFLLGEGNSFVITITPLDGKNVRNVEVVLDGLGDHEPGTVRIQLEVLMESEDTIRINATDMGFGAFRMATHQLFTQKIQIKTDMEQVKE